MLSLVPEPEVVAFLDFTSLDSLVVRCGALGLHGKSYVKLLHVLAYPCLHGLATERMSKLWEWKTRSTIILTQITQNVDVSWIYL